MKGAWGGKGIEVLGLWVGEGHSLEKGEGVGEGLGGGRKFGVGEGQEWEGRRMLGVSGSGRWLLKNGKGLSMGWMGAWRSAG